MFIVLKSLFDKPLSEVETVWSVLGNVYNQVLLEDSELRHVNFFKQCIELTGYSPTEVSFLEEFGEDEKIYLNAVEAVSISDARLRVSRIFQERRNLLQVQNLQGLLPQILEEGFSPEVEREFLKIKSQGITSNKVKEVSLDYQEQFEKVYAERKANPDGILTFIPEVDDYAGGITDGSLTTIGGYSSHGKSVWAVNMAYCNCFYAHKKVCFLSFELTKNEMLFNLLCRHSADSKFTKYEYISHDKQRKGRLTAEEEDYLYNVVASDFMEFGGNGGCFILLDGSDFVDMSFSSLQAKMEEVDEKYGPVDVWFWDYIQIFGEVTLPEFRGLDIRSKVDAYAFKILSWALNFRGRKTCQILLAQTNREGVEKAAKNGGKYEPSASCLYFCNGPYTWATRFMTVFSSPGSRETKGAVICVLKSRNGRSTIDPLDVYFDPASYVFGLTPENLKATPSFSSMVGALAPVVTGSKVELDESFLGL